MDRLHNYKIHFSIAVFLLLLPLLFIGINNFHDWGDDFAQYLLQAKLFAGSIKNLPVTDIQSYGPQIKGPLFSLILAPFTLVGFGDIAGGKILVTISHIFCGYLLFRMMALKFNLTAAFILSLVFAYNYHILNLKDQVLPDLLFTGITLAIILLYNAGGKKNIMWAILLTVLLTGIKSAGFAMVLALGLSLLFADEKWHVKIPNFLLLVVGCAFMTIWENLLSDGIVGSTWYLETTINGWKWEYFVSGFAIYLRAVEIIFEQEMPMFLNHIIKYVVLTGIAGGFLKAIFLKIKLRELYVLSYLITLLVYPYPHDPVRLAVPLIPFFLMYILEFYEAAYQYFTKKNGAIVTIIISAILALSQGISTKNALVQKPVYATVSKESIEMLNYVRNTIPATDKICFSKPWALALFTAKICIPASAHGDADWIITENTGKNEISNNSNETSQAVFVNNQYVIHSSK